MPRPRDGAGPPVRTPPGGVAAAGGPPPPGSAAAAPQRIPRRGWVLVLRRVGRRVLEDRAPVMSAGIAFFALLSIAPLLVTALSVYGVVSTPQQALDQLSGVAAMLPPQLGQVVADQLSTSTAASTQVLTVRGLTGLLIAMWTATTATTALIDGLTLAYHEEETRGFGRRTLLGLVFVLGGAVTLAAVLVAAGVVSTVLAGAPGPPPVVARGAAWAVVATLMVLVLAVLYRFGPDRKEARWRWVTWGATGATVLWLLASMALLAYVRRLGTYEATYGSLAGVVISMFWLWFTILLVLAGATLNAEAERQTARDSTVGPEQPVGRRGAVVADSVPPYPGEEGPAGSSGDRPPGR